jgi:hypothetical protein
MQRNHSYSYQSLALVYTSNVSKGSVGLFVDEFLRAGTIPGNCAQAQGGGHCSAC